MTAGAGAMDDQRAHDAPALVMTEARDDRAVFEYSRDGVLVTVPDGQILAANPAARVILGADESEIRRLGRRGLSLTSDRRWGPLLEERRATGSVQGMAWMVR